ncbi:hypothetical protein [Actinoplanes sp. URMC 104]|uniref:hypothetical protein n=1 Tax=Actinoplanes sp. URMC 104 TaxID=3423409 RepID=UPI003F1AFCDE
MRTSVAGVVAGAVTLTLAGGCAAQQIQALEPKLELRNAAQQLADAQQAGFTIKLTGNPADLVAAVGKEADAATVDQLFNSSITMAYDKGGAGAEDDASSLSATIDGVTGTEIRYVGRTLYAKAPVTELAKKFGATPADLKQLSGAGSNPGTDALFAGKWVSVDTSELTGLTGAEPTPDAQSRKAVDELTKAATNLLEGAEVVRDSADDKHLIATSSTAKAYAEAKRVATAVEPSLASEFPKAPADRPIVLDLWIDGGKLTAVEINVLQFADGATGRVAARLEMTTGAPIATPEGATKVDLGNLPQPAIGGSLGGLGDLTGE